MIFLRIVIDFANVDSYYYLEFMLYIHLFSNPVNYFSIEKERVTLTIRAFTQEQSFKTGHE